MEFLISIITFIMKKTGYYILFIFLLCSPIYGADLKAELQDIILIPAAADWEREADARIWSGRVVSDFKSGSSRGFRLNALCDESAFNEIEKIKSISLDIIKSDIDSGRSSSKGALALEIFERGEQYIHASDDVNERADIALFKSLPRGENFNIPADITGTGYPEMPVIHYGISAGVTTGTGSVQLKKHGSDSGRVKVSHIICRNSLNLSPLWDREKSDSYRIFLYIRDDDRIKDLSANIIFPPSSVLLRHLHFTDSNIGTEFLHITEHNIKINIKRLILVRDLFAAYPEAGPLSNFQNHSIYTSGVLS